MAHILTDTQVEQLRVKHAQLSLEVTQDFSDQQKRAAVMKEFARIDAILERYTLVETLQREQATLKTDLEATREADMRALIEEELADIQHKLAAAERSFEDAVFPADERDDRSVFLEIRAGAGGQEAALFVGDLLRMYLLYAQRKGWRTSLVEAHDTDLGGYREVILQIEGRGVYGHLKRESGVHRVQRVPQTETAGRIHTSTVTVAVLPEAEEVELSINPADLRIDVYRSGGAGGQHVNTTDSAVRITHIPTGLVVTCQDERSQHKNKAKALKVLQSRLLAKQQEQHAHQQSQLRKQQVGTGERAEKVRTYNYPQNRVTDHQVEVTLSKLDIIMQGDLDDIVEPLMEKDRRDRRSHLAV